MDQWQIERDRMVAEQLISRDITDPHVLEAMGQVPREQFVNAALISSSYADSPLQIGYGQTISQPYIVAKMCELLNVTKDDKVLDVGTGSGYQAAVLSLLAKEVISIERINPLAVKARKILKQLGYLNVEVLWGDGFMGVPQAAPFDAIVAAAAPHTIPEAWKDHIKEGGVIVFPLAENRRQYLVRVTKEVGTFSIEKFNRVAFVPLL